MKDENFKQLKKSWSDSYKSGHLSMWILLSISERKKYSEEILDFIVEKSEGYILPEKLSLYRSLRKLEDLELAESEEVESEAGPKRKYFIITNDGKKLLSSFIQNDVLFYEKTNLNKFFKQYINE